MQGWARRRPVQAPAPPQDHPSVPRTGLCPLSFAPSSTHHVVASEMLVKMSLQFPQELEGWGADSSELLRASL